jgi:hypothetical protein
MTMQKICQHEQAEMAMRRANPDQHDQHIWAWLVEMLRLWGDANPITIRR